MRVRVSMRVSLCACLSISSRLVVMLVGILELPFLCTCTDVCKRVSPVCVRARARARVRLPGVRARQTAMKMEIFENLMLRGALYIV
eukprot:COSAG03_NODE_7376_length_926_cov_1.218863_2_plen_87_part_00